MADLAPPLQNALISLQKELEGLIVGKRTAAWSCCCGKIQKSAGTATAVKFKHLTVEKYQRLLSNPNHWLIEVTCDDGGEYYYSFGGFINNDVLAEIFQRHLGPVANLIPS